MHHQAKQRAFLVYWSTHKHERKKINIYHERTHTTELSSSALLPHSPLSLLFLCPKSESISPRAQTLPLLSVTHHQAFFPPPTTLLQGCTVRSERSRANPRSSPDVAKGERKHSLGDKTNGWNGTGRNEMGYLF